MQKQKIAGFILLACMAACSTEPAPGPGEATHVKAQHILISFEGQLKNKSVARTKAEAETLAQSILARAQAGEDFGALVKQYTDDRAPGVYGMVNHGTMPDVGYYPRAAMAQSFGDVAFSLQKDQIGMAAFDPDKSPFGWHIIKRLE